jgi:hypothetical protein
MTVSRTTRAKALPAAIAGTALFVALAAGAAARAGDTGSPAIRSTSAAVAVTTRPAAPTTAAGPALDRATTTPAPAPAAALATATTAPATTKPTAAPTTATTRKATSPASTATSAPTQATATTVAAAKPAPGVRIAYTTASVQTAATALHQRIPLFAPTDAQLENFADAVCTSFDQGQTWSQVVATVQDAVSRIQGQSLSQPDADFAVRTVVQLRCPGYLP